MGFQGWLFITVKIYPSAEDRSRSAAVGRDLPMNARPVRIGRLSANSPTMEGCFWSLVNCGLHDPICLRVRLVKQGRWGHALPATWRVTVARLY